MHSVIYIAAAAFLVAWFLFSTLKARHILKQKRVEGASLPGPQQLPFIGRVHDLPVQYMWLKLKKWADIYGPIYYTSMFGAEFIVVSEESVAEELLVKRAKYNSDRPMMRSVTDSKSTEGGGEYLPLMGKNRETSLLLDLLLLTTFSRVLGSSAPLCSWQTHRSGQCRLARYSRSRDQTMAFPPA